MDESLDDADTRGRLLGASYSAPAHVSSMGENQVHIMNERPWAVALLTS